MKTTKLYDYRTKALVGEISAEGDNRPCISGSFSGRGTFTAALNKFCAENGYLPHHKVSGGWVVIK